MRAPFTWIKEGDGVAKEFAKSFYESKAWKRCRRSYIAGRMMIDGGTCEVCKENPGYILHHKIILTKENINDPNVSLNWSNLRWECKACHDAEEGHGVSNKRAGLLVAFDAEGQPIPLPPCTRTMEAFQNTGARD